MKNLIVTADDCGLSKGINLATVELHQKGIVTDASVMTNFPATAYALELFARYPQLKVGVHLNLTEGSALTLGVDGWTLANRHLPGTLGLLARLPSASFREWVEKELDAQINVLIRAGFQPQHLTTHIHFHVLPALREIVLRLAQKYRVPWVRPHRLRVAVIPFNPFLQKKIAPSESDSAKFAQAPGYIVVLKFWMRTNPAKLLTILRELPGNIELVVHPCLVEDESFPKSMRYKPEERFQETRYLERFWLCFAESKED